MIFILIIYYLTKLINIKIINFINFQKFYSKDERLESVGNYYQMITNSFKLYSRNNSKISKNELYFNYLNIIDNFSLNLEFKYYHNYLLKNKKLLIIEFFELS